MCKQYTGACTSFIMYPCLPTVGSSPGNCMTQWLSNLEFNSENVASYATIFHQEAISEQALRLLTLQDLQSLGIEKFGHRALIHNTLQEGWLHSDSKHKKGIWVSGHLLNCCGHFAQLCILAPLSVLCLIDNQVILSLIACAPLIHNTLQEGWLHSDSKHKKGIGSSLKLLWALCSITHTRPFISVVSN